MVHKKRIIAEDEEYIVYRDGNRIEAVNKTDGESFSADIPKKNRTPLRGIFKKLVPGRKERD